MATCRSAITFRWDEVIGMATSKNCIGLDIGSSAVKICSLKKVKKGQQLQVFDYAPLPQEAIVDGALMNAGVVTDAIAELVSRNKLRGNRDVALSVSGNTVIIKKVTLPLMTREELDDSIQWEAEQYIPYDIKDVYIGYEVIAPRTDQGQMDVVLVAAKREMIDDYTGVTRDAGLNPIVVDVDAFCLQNAYEVNYGFHENESVVLLDIGHSVVTMNVITDGVSMFTRDLSMGGADITEEIQRQLNITYTEAELYKMGSAPGMGKDDVLPHEVEKIIGQKAEDMAGEIQRSIDFYSATASDSSIDRIIVSGGTASIPSLVRIISKTSGVPADLANPFRGVNYDERTFSSDNIKKWAPIAAVSVGLALRRTNER
jgi:type IV pilus assembly protein PilM